MAKDNPLKMQGAWIGLILFFIMGVIGVNNCNWNPIDLSVVPHGLCRTSMVWVGLPAAFSITLPLVIFGSTNEQLYGRLLPFALFGGIINGIFGFLIGWAIHSLIKKLR